MRQAAAVPLRISTPGVDRGSTGAMRLTTYDCAPVLDDEL
jgi:hypothetical protein